SQALSSRSAPLRSGQFARTRQRVRTYKDLPPPKGERAFGQQDGLEVLHSAREERLDQEAMWPLDPRWNREPKSQGEMLGYGREISILDRSDASRRIRDGTRPDCRAAEIERIEELAEQRVERLPGEGPSRHLLQGRWTGNRHWVARYHVGPISRP